MSSRVFEMQSPGARYKMVDEQQEEVNTNDTPTQQTHIDWHRPAVMYGSLLTGLAFAIGHYAFYTHLNKLLVDSTISQTWVNRIGTAFAFLVKLSFVVAAATAYTQRQWLTMGSETFKMGQIDSMVGVLDNVFNFLHVLLWLRHPILASMALVTWLLPLAAIVSPGSITVNSIAHTDNVFVQVPQLLYNQSNFADVAGPGSFTYQRPQATVSRIAFASATMDQILERYSPSDNNTYSLTFFAPALRCNEANSSLSSRVANITLYYEEEVGQTWDFIAWVGGDNHGIDSTNISEWNPAELYQSLDYVSLDAARLYIAALDFKPHGTGVPPTTTFECQCWNASYQVRFSSSSKIQSTELMSMQYLNGVPKAGLGNVSIYLEPEMLSYNAVMDAFGRLLVGYTFHDRHGSLIDDPYSSSSPLTSIDWYNKNTIPRSVENLFHNLTMSLFSASALLKNSTRAEDISVDVTTYPLIYVFKPRDLVLAYGISLIITIICTVLGTHAIIINRACYQNMFSTFVRTARNSDRTVPIDSTDTGVDPLPRRIAEANFSIDRLRRRRP